MEIRITTERPCCRIFTLCTLTNSLFPKCPPRIVSSGCRCLSFISAAAESRQRSCYALPTRAFPFSKPSSRRSTALIAGAGRERAPSAVSCVRLLFSSKDASPTETSGGEATESIHANGVVPKSDADSRPSSAAAGEAAGEAAAGEGERRKELLTEEAWRLLKEAVVDFGGVPVGTVAAKEPGEVPDDRDRVFVRDFVPSALAFLMRGDGEIVHNFLLHALQSWEKAVDCCIPGHGLMPDSFKVRTVSLDGNNEGAEEILDPVIDMSAIGRVTPVDSGLWWIILLSAYGRVTGDYSLQERGDVQTGIRLILNLCLSDGFYMFPTLHVVDGSCMIDRRMGIHGHPLEIQALFYSALSCSRDMITTNDESLKFLRAIDNRLSALSFYMREYYWVDLKKINVLYRYQTEGHPHVASNRYNIYAELIPAWLFDWIPEKGGYFIGNLQPAHMDFRFFSLGNLWAIVSSLATPWQAKGILKLIECNWDDLVANMPLKICYPALEYNEWRIITGSDPKNTSWSCHNGGSWPTLLWQFTLACIKMGRPELAHRALSIAENRLSSDKWPEFYGTKPARFIGKQARLYQTSTIAGFLTSKMLLENPEMASIFIYEEVLELH